MIVEASSESKASCFSLCTLGIIYLVSMSLPRRTAQLRAIEWGTFLLPWVRCWRTFFRSRRVCKEWRAIVHNLLTDRSKPVPAALIMRNPADLDIPMQQRRHIPTNPRLRTLNLSPTLPSQQHWHGLRGILVHVSCGLCSPSTMEGKPLVYSLCPVCRHSVYDSACRHHHAPPVFLDQWRCTDDFCYFFECMSTLYAWCRCEGQQQEEYLCQNAFEGGFHRRVYGHIPAYLVQVLRERTPGGKLSSVYMGNLHLDTL